MISLWAGKRFSPANVSGGAAWFKFNSGITITGSGAAQWDDAFGLGHHLLQATDANRPIKEASGSLRFSGDKFMKCTGFALEQPTTIYFRGKHHTWTTGDALYDGNASNTGKLYQSGASPNLSATSDGAAILSSDPDLALDTLGTVSVGFNGANSFIRIGDNAAVTGDAGAGDMAGFNLGSRTGTTGASDIEVWEVIIYGAALSAADDASIRAYLASVG